MAQQESTNTIIKEYRGDLNNDKISDIIMIEAAKCGYYDDEARCRIVTISLLDKDGSSLFSFYSPNIIPCSFCDDHNISTLKKVKIRKNSFSFILIHKLIPEETTITETMNFKYHKIVNNFILQKKVRTIKSYKNGNVEFKTQIQTPKDFGQVYFSDYR
ncbi:hypothetical protein [Chryseobacterium defluvii]|uniref:Uncharacterized protein n=1 Tax=Chryseobacterium defluvii TaxID=160396 RepID=A0A495SCX8_9FLAO|nr:hypothetical protein [Chryseobacterium defluvii]RKS97331.1 hypothetical protein BCF58_1453 [Chryseobacterium defluvii]